MKMKLWPVVFFILLGLAPAALAQSPLPTPIPAATPVSTATPLSVLIVTPVVTPAPPSAWPAEVEKAIAFVGSLWRTFGWWVILILLGAGLFALARLVGKELFTTWSKQMAAWLDDRRKNLLASLRRGPGPAERALLDDIFDRYEYLEMKGFVREKVMTASLESIYVPLFTRAGEQSGPFRRGGELPGLVVREQSGEPTPLA
ncbi:MAG: hypothetical protein JXM69_21600, partial [Anaerolineae bacterium]|nr:hypothetical protein [Anaerolineae bacterium]